LVIVLSVLLLLVIVLSVLLRFAVSDYPLWYLQSFLQEPHMHAWFIKNVR
jgi:hypothetical protein